MTDHNAPCDYTKDQHDALKDHIAVNQTFETRIWEAMQLMETRLRELFERVRDRLPNWAFFMMSAQWAIIAALATVLAVLLQAPK